MRIVLIVAAAVCGSPPQAGTAPQAPAVILDTRSHWRSFVMFRPSGYGGAAPAEKAPAEPHTPPPPPNWFAPEFDDCAWGSFTGPVQGGYGARQEGSVDELALVCLRGRFRVTDRSKVQAVVLSLTFRGGAVVYLNGREVARAHLPPGPLTPETPAKAYPWETYVAPDGVTPITASAADLKAHKDRLRLRLRRLSDVAVPLDLVREGENVLAVELHRAPHDPRAKALKEFPRTGWTTLGLTDASLTATGAGVEPNVRRPTGVQVWNADALTAVFDVDWGDRAEPLRPIRLLAPQNGVGLGQVVVGSDTPIRELKAEVGVLTKSAGGPAIPTGNVRLYYPLPTGSERGTADRYAGVREPSRMDGLAESPPAEVPVRPKPRVREYTGPPPVFGAVQPVQVRVRVPADAAAGLYRGTLTISIQPSAVTGQPGPGAVGPQSTMPNPQSTIHNPQSVEVPIELTVADWHLPDRDDWTVHLGIIQSPDTLAIHYQVPLWSEDHWRYIARSLEVLGEAGTNAVFIPLIARHHFGKEGMVHWVKKPDGTYDHDFRIFERYIDLALKHLGRPQVVCLYAWDLNQ